ncbi:MAG: 16S rRNA (cytosine(1402)-N(4))-methyltransferase RsmH [Planctomycetota bacterium]|jgi:16S rRNA (cytosine1402-N4)-methyltransferase
MTEPVHVSVLAAEILAGLDPQPGQIIVDGTVGVGGHTKLLAERIGPSGMVIGLDQDPNMLTFARARLGGLPVRLVHANFENFADVLQELQVGAIDAFLCDLGFCSDQIGNPARGFSFQHDGPLDMRLDPTSGEPASDLVRRLPEKELADLIYQYGEERLSRRIAKVIVEARKSSPIETTRQLAELVRRCVPRSKGSHIDPATRTFQALRIAVNDELGALERLLVALPEFLKPGGLAAIISFHSLEDRMVKRAFRVAETWQVVTRKPIMASDDEIAVNPRSRSAKLRIARKFDPSLPSGKPRWPKHVDEDDDEED